MKIAIGADHGGFEMKSELISRLEQAGYPVDDRGTYTTESCDYPDIAEIVARGVSAGDYDLGILICGTGIGVSMAANKVEGVRAALLADCFSARMAREHNDANVITLGARTLGIELAWEIVESFLKASFLGDKHARRVDKIMRIC